MQKKLLNKKVSKVSYMSAGLILGSMIGGAALASAGWWYTDRLDIANLFGKPVDINKVGKSQDEEDGKKNKKTNQEKQAEKRAQEQCRSGCSYETTNKYGQKVKVTATYTDATVNRVAKTQSGTYSLVPNLGKVNGGWQIKQVVVYTPEELRQIEIDRIKNDDELSPATKAKMLKKVYSENPISLPTPNTPAEAQ